jgi:hypothetical protein
VALIRKTYVVHGRLAMREKRVCLAKEGAFGVAVMTFEQIATRLAGGFSRPIDPDTLRQVIHRVLPTTELGELDAIKLLPGMTGAAADTLHKAWRAGINLQARADEHPRIAAIAALEAAVVTALPPGMLRPGDLVTRAIERIEYAPAVLGCIKIEGLTELSPCWRPLLSALAGKMAVEWDAGPRHVPNWLGGTGVDVLKLAAHTPLIEVESAATALHEVIEALRWARELIATGCAKPSEIAFAAASPSEYDDYLLTLRADANIDVSFVHGVSAMATRDGQAAAALADILVRGLSRTRMLRLASLCHDSGLFEGLPENWARVMPADVPLGSKGAWDRLLEKLTTVDWPEKIDHTPKLGKLVEVLSKGLVDAEAAGRAVLPRTALKIWMKGLQNGPPAAISMTLLSLRIDDSMQAPNTIAWMPASALTASPRRFVRLLGLTSRAWPRLASEDRLLPAHVMDNNELDPLPIGTADRRDFASILATTETHVVLSRPRRDGEGRLLGKSPLLRGLRATEQYLQRNRTPGHAMSEADRLTARTNEHRTTPLAASANGCWVDWQAREITAHDGLVRTGHPMIAHTLGRMQSATSLKVLLRDPIGFVWKYGLGWKASLMGGEPLTLEHRDYGDILHKTLEGAVKRLEAADGVAKASREAVAAAVAEAMKETAVTFEADHAVPPQMIWKRALGEIQNLAFDVIRPEDETLLPGQRSFAEVTFSAPEHENGGELPWDSTTLVPIPGTDLRIRGAIDRLDLSSDGLQARVSDYKTGRPPKDGAPYILAGGKELQRCLYSFAVKALLGPDVHVEAALRYPRSGVSLKLENADAVLTELARYLHESCENLAGGRAILGPDTASEWNDLAFALPANAAKSYYVRKEDAATEAMGDAALVWKAD